MGRDGLQKVLSNIPPPPPRPIFDLSGADRQQAEEDNARQSCHPEVTQQAVKQGSGIKYCFRCLLFIYIYLFILAKLGNIVSVGGEPAPMGPTKNTFHLIETSKFLK